MGPKTDQRIKEYHERKTIQEKRMGGLIMTIQQVIVQASSRSWLGGRDYCMSPIDGKPVVYWTVKRMLDNIPNAKVTVASPEFDKNGELGQLVDSFPLQAVSIFNGYDDSPLSRILEICRDLKEDDYIIRVDGLHLFVDIDATLKMLSYAKETLSDCVKMPDDFPIQFTSDIYRVGALRKLQLLLDSEDMQTKSIFRVHPKFYMFIHEESFKCAYLGELPRYTDPYLLECRETAKFIYNRPRQEADEQRTQWSGDQLSFHYELASKYLKKHMNVLDAGCGDGFGVRILADLVSEIHGVDLDVAVTEEAKSHTNSPNAVYHAQDVTNMEFSNDMFDCITCFEVIEHVDPDALLRECKRVLKPEGTLIISTPQNCIGFIPITAVHLREYSLDDFVDICSKYFEVETIIGLKAGRIIVPGDPIGTNTMLVCRKQFVLSK